MLALLVHTQLLMAASAAAILFASTRLLGMPLSPWWYLAATLGTWTIYLLDAGRSRLDEDSLSQPQRAALFCQRPALYVVLPWVTGAGALISVFFAHPPIEAIGLLAALGACGIAYAVPLLPSRSGNFRTLKDIALLKPLTICLAWTLGAALLPWLANTSLPTWPAAGWLGGLLFFLLLADTLLLDLRDAEGDEVAGVSTFAVRFGTRPTHAAVGLCLIAAAFAFVFGTPTFSHPKQWHRVGLAALGGFTLAWLFWPPLRRTEAGTASAMMAWRFLAAFSAL